MSLPRKKISQFTTALAASLASGDYFPFVDVSADDAEKNKKITYAELLTVFSGGGGEWGSITGTLADQTDLQSAIDAKFSMPNLTDDRLVVHGGGSLEEVNVTSAEAARLSGVTSNIQTQLDAKVSNATHTGDVTGATALTIASVAITGQASVTAAVGDSVLISDASDSDNLKKVTIQSIVDLVGGVSLSAANTWTALQTLDAGVAIKGTGATSATTSLLVENSTGWNALEVKDDGYVQIGDYSSPSRSYTLMIYGSGTGGSALIQGRSSIGTGIFRVNDSGDAYIYKALNIGADSYAPSAFLGIEASTTSKAHMNLDAGSAPTSPNNGDIWFDGADLFLRAGGTTGAISINFHGGFYVSTPAETSISTINTPVKAAGATTTFELVEFDDDTGTDNRLKFLGTSNQCFEIAASLSVTAASNNIVMSVYIAVNGAVLSESQIKRKIGTGTDVGAFSVSTLKTLSENDYVEIFLENNTDNTNLTIQYLNLSIK